MVDYDSLREVGRHYYYDKFALYQSSIEEFIQRGFGILGRTMIECSVDLHCESFVRQLLQFKKLFTKPVVVVDLCAGSGNLLYHLAKGLNAVASYGFEFDPDVYKQTVKNFEILNFQCKLYGGDFKNISDLKEQLGDQDVQILFIVAPPWGDAFSHEDGLDLTKTHPPT
jgi:hypothetical protein